MKPRILIVGSSNIDFVCTMPYVPQAGQTVISEGSYAFVPGGKGANTAVGAARLGADAVFCTRLGNDAYASQLKARYQKEGVDTRFVKADKTAATGFATIMVEHNGANRIVVYPGANKKLSTEDVEDAFTCYPDAFILQFEIPEEIALFACSQASKKDVKIFVDAGPASSDFPLESLPPLEVFSPNETETAIYTGILPNSSDNCLRAAIALSERVTAKYIVIKLGERGCFIYDGTHCHHMAPVEVPNVIDTTAAGDAYTAAMTHKYLETKDIYKACEYANAVGAYVVTKKGALSSLPTNKELDDFLKQLDSL